MLSGVHGCCERAVVYTAIVGEPVRNDGGFAVQMNGNQLCACEFHRTRGRADDAPVALPDRFYVGQSPCLVEPRFQRTVEPDYREPALAGQGLDPVAASLGLFGTEVDVD